MTYERGWSEALEAAARHVESYGHIDVIANAIRALPAPTKEQLPEPTEGQLCDEQIIVGPQGHQSWKACVLPKGHEGEHALATPREEKLREFADKLVEAIKARDLRERREQARKESQ